MANERERERTKSLNQALEILRNRIPVPDAEKRSKIQTLKMAKVYIEFLHELNAWKQSEQQVDPISSTASQTSNNANANASNSININHNDNTSSHTTLSSQPLLHTSSVGAPTPKPTTDLHQEQLETSDPSASPLSYKFYVFRQNT